MSQKITKAYGISQGWALGAGYAPGYSPFSQAVPNLLPDVARGWRKFGSFLNLIDNPAYRGRTYLSITEAEADFDQVEIMLENYDPDNDIVIDGMIAAVSANATSLNLPSGGAGSYVPVLQNGQTAIVVPKAASGVAVSARPGIAVVTVNLSSIARNDGGTRPILYIACYQSAGKQSFLGAGGTAIGTDWRSTTANATTLGRFMIARSAAGDFVSSNRGGFSGDFNFPYFAGLGFNFRFRLKTGKIMTVADYGNSITEGNASVQGLRSPGHAAVYALSTAAKPITYANLGFASSRTTSFVGRMKDNYASGFRPSHVLIAMGSPNDIFATDYPTYLATMKTNLDEGLATALANGATVVLKTMMPRSGFDASQELVRTSINAYGKTKASSRVLICDFEAATSNGANPASIKPGLSDDGLHLNDAGIDAASPVLQAVLQGLQTTFYA